METFSALLAICAGNSAVPGQFPHKGQWRGALMFSSIWVWINGWVNSREAGDLRCYCTHYDVIVMVNAWNWSTRNWTHYHLKKSISKPCTYFMGLTPLHWCTIRPILSLISARINNHRPSIVWHGIVFSFPNFNGCTVDIWEWSRSFISHLIMDVIIYPYRDLSWSMSVNGFSGSHAISNHQQLHSLMNKPTPEKTLLCITDRLWGESTSDQLVDSTHKLPVIWKVFPHYDFFNVYYFIALHICKQLYDIN